MSLYSDRIIKDGAVAYWRLDETSGTIAKSQVGSFDGTISGSVILNQSGALVDGTSAMLFNPNGVSTDGSIVVPVGSYSAIGTGPATLECWAKVGIGSFINQLVVATSANILAAGTAIGFRDNGSSVMFRVMLAGSQTDATYPHANIADGQWHHLVGVIRRSTSDTIEFWVDGVSRVTVTIPSAGRDFTSPDSSRIGGDPTHQWNGGIDEVAIYKIDLSPAQIYAHYQLGIQTYKSSSPYAQAVVNDGAIAFWRLGETVGSVARSEVGNFNGSITGGVQLGQPGSSADNNPSMGFDGTTGRIDVPNGPFLGFGIGSFSFELWTRRISTPLSFSQILVGGTGSNINRTLIYQNTSDDRIFFILYDAAGTSQGVTAAAAISNGLWQHIVGVVRRGPPDKIEIYYNGVLGQSISATTSGLDFSLTTPFKIASSLVNSSFFGGGLDDVAIYPIALTPAQIATHYALAKSIQSPYSSQIIQDGAVAYWRLGETSGTVARDELGLNNGTYNGGYTQGQTGALGDGNKSVQFNGSTGLVSIPASVLDCGPATQSFSVEFWVNGALASSNEGIIQKSNSAFNGGGSGWSFRSRGMTNNLFEFIRNPTRNPTPTRGNAVPMSTPNVWSHYVVIYNASIGTMFVYVNGIMRGSQAWTGLDIGAYTDNFSLEIGRADGLFINAMIDEVALYNYVLTPAQISQHYSLRSSQLPASVKLGTGSFQLIAGVPYAMPPRISYVTASGPLQGSNDPQFGSFTTLTTPGNIAAGFIRSNSNITVSISPRR